MIIAILDEKRVDFLKNKYSLGLFLEIKMHYI